MQIYTVESLSGQRIREGELLYANAVLAANLLRDVREAITNAIGGKMRRYESVLDRVTEQALTLLKEKAAGKGYDGLVAVRITSPFMVQGSAAITVYGTGFSFVSRESPHPAAREEQ
jgi:uncharacterized protein YbjQ (UPF0145 family)